jgi:hypothetical protein
MPPAISKNDSSPANLANDTSAGTFRYFYCCEKSKKIVNQGYIKFMCEFSYNEELQSGYFC